MTLEQRNAYILKMLEERAKKNTRSKAAAKAALDATGIYTKKGKVRAEFGGEPNKKINAA